MNDALLAAARPTLVFVRVISLISTVAGMVVLVGVALAAVERAQRGGDEQVVRRCASWLIVRARLK